VIFWILRWILYLESALWLDWHLLILPSSLFKFTWLNFLRILAYEFGYIYAAWECGLNQFYIWVTKLLFGGYYCFGSYFGSRWEAVKDFVYVRDLFILLRRSLPPFLVYFACWFSYLITNILFFTFLTGFGSIILICFI